MAKDGSTDNKEYPIAWSVRTISHAGTVVAEQEKFGTWVVKDKPANNPITLVYKVYMDGFRGNDIGGSLRFPAAANGAVEAATMPLAAATACRGRSRL